MMVYIWWRLRDYPPSMIGKHHPLRSPDYLDYQEARRLPDDYRAMTFIEFDQPLAKVLRFDCLDNSMNVPLVSPRLREALEKAAPGEVQFLPARIVAKGGETEGYTIVNALSKVHAIDWEASVPKHLSDGGTVWGWRKLVHKPDGMGDVGIGRDADYVRHILVSERVKTALDEGGFKFRGLGLRPASDIPW